MNKKNRKQNNEKPEIFAVNKCKNKNGVTRREFVGLLGASAVLTGIRSNTFAKDNKSQTSGKLSGDLCGMITAHSGKVNAVAFSPDGTILASGSEDQTIKLWRLPTGNLLKTLTNNSGYITSISFSPDGTLLASGSTDKTIKLWRLPDGDLLKTLTGHSSYFESITVTFSPNGTMLASGSRDKTIKLWSLPDGNLLTTLTGHSGDVVSVAFNPDGTLLASGSWDSTIKIWQLPEGKLIKTLRGHSGCSLAFSPDGTLLASGSGDSTIRLWRLRSRVTANETTKTGSGNAGTLVGAAAASILLSKTIPSANEADSRDQIENRYENNDAHQNKGKCKPIVIGLGTAIAAGTAVVSIQGCSKPMLEAKLLKTLTEHIWSVNSVAFSPDGKILASGSEDKTINLYRLPDGNLVKTLTGHSNNIRSIAFSPDGTLLASGGDDNTIKLWRLPQGEPNWCLFHLIQEEMEVTDYRAIKQMGPKIMTLPCGSPMPPGATCICDCVQSSRTYPGSEKICVCNTILVSSGITLSKNIVCTCDTISIGTKGTNRSDVKRVRRTSGSICTCNTVCTCNTICTCDSVATPSCSSCGGHYWHPN